MNEKDRNTSMKSHLITAEAVRVGHPDKFCDQMADRLLDKCLRVDPNTRAAIEEAKSGLRSGDWSDKINQAARGAIYGRQAYVIVNLNPADRAEGYSCSLYAYPERGEWKRHPLPRR